MATSGHLGAVFMNTGPSVTFTNLPATDTSTTRLRYRLTDATKRYMDRTAATTVQTSPDGTTWTTISTGLTVEFTGGEVVFDTARAAGTQVRISGKAYPVAQAAAFTSWSMDLEREMLDVTVFESPSGFQEFMPSPIMAATGSVERMWSTAAEYFAAVTGGTEVILVLYTDRANNDRYEFAAVFNSQNVETPFDELITESMDFQSVSAVYYRENA